MRAYMTKEIESIDEYIDIPVEQQEFTFTFTSTENLEQQLNE